TNFSAGYFGRVLQVENLAIESNVIELASRISGDGGIRSVGVFLYGALFPPPFIYRNVVLRENIIREMDNGFGVPPLPQEAGITFVRSTTGIEVYSVKSAMVQENIIRLNESQPLHTIRLINIRLEPCCSALASVLGIITCQPGI